MDKKVKFIRKVGYRGATLGINIPQELLAYLDIHEGDEITLIGDNSKHGKYIAIYKEGESDANKTR